MGIKGLWGSRGDYKTNLNLKVSIHKKISISANIGGIIRVGATHNRAKEPCMVCDGNPLKALEKEVKSMVDSSDFRLKEIFCGMRSSSKDYFPLVGEIVDVSFMLKSYPNLKHGAKAPLKKLPNIYILNGVGGRGFLFAPYLANILTEYILNKTPIEDRINPDRLFFKWCRKSLKDTK
jgi:tRNA 5-methylaminomethyl-2-thiouridine biosynthesis bifunctional protein